MNAGKQLCETLKSIRQEIAEQNNLVYNPTECNHEGDCRGTCPLCDDELRDLQRQLDEKGITEVLLYKDRKVPFSEIEKLFDIPFFEDHVLMGRILPRQEEFNEELTEFFS